MIKSKKIIGAAACVLLVGILSVVPVYASDNTAVCNKALLKCGIDTAIAGLLSGGTVMWLMTMGCLIGYDFCLKFYVEL